MRLRLCFMAVPNEDAFPVVTIADVVESQHQRLLESLD
jgi:hypothetical protein